MLRHSGQLSKFTNLVKGWQYRWFVLHPEAGTLEYHLVEERQERQERGQSRHHPRGGYLLVGAVVEQEEEDDLTFSVTFASGEVFKLRTESPEERQGWVERIRAVVEHGQEESTPGTPAEEEKPRKNLQSMKQKMRKLNIGRSKRSGVTFGPVQPVYKALMLGPNNTAKDRFMTVLGEDRTGVNEVILKTDQSDIIFWRADVQARPSIHCLKQYLTFLNPKMIFYFISLDEKEDHLELFRILDLITIPTKVCLAFEESSVNGFYSDGGTQMSEDDFNFLHCFANFESIKTAAEEINKTMRNKMDAVEAIEESVEVLEELDLSSFRENVEELSEEEDDDEIYHEEVQD